MGSSKHEVSETENGLPVRKPGKMAKMKQHFVKFWWLHLIIFVLLTLTLLLLCFYVIVPVIAQDKINKAKLEIQGVAVENPEPDWYLMSINSTIRTDGQVKATIDPFIGDMYLEELGPEHTFAKIRFPQTNANKFQMVNVSKQYIEINNREAFTTFNEWFTNNETLKVTIKGKPSVTPRGLAKSYSVDFKKTLELKGLNKLEGIKVNNATVEFTTNKKNSTDFRNFWATTEIPNPSHFTLQIGNAVFNNYAAGQNFGKLYVDDFVLRPGMNEVKASGNIDQAKILEVGSQRPYCESGIIDFTLVGTNVTNLDGHFLSYFTTALANTNTTVGINVTETLYNSKVPASISCSSE